MFGRSAPVECLEMTDVDPDSHSGQIGRAADVERTENMDDIEKSGNEDDKKHMQRLGKMQELVVSHRSRRGCRRVFWSC